MAAPAPPPQYDLSSQVTPFLDRHMVLQLLEFLSKTPLYDEKSVLQAKLEAVSKTSMHEYHIEIYEKLHPGNTEDTTLSGFKAKTEELSNQFAKLKTEIAPLVAVLANDELVKQLKTDKNFTLPYLQEKHQVTAASVESLYSFAKLQYEAGNYQPAAGLLFHYRALSTNPERNFHALWGKLAAEILSKNWEVAIEDLSRLREAVDSRNTSPVLQLQQRAWLLHWGLFVFFNHPNGRNLMVDLCLSPQDNRYLNAVQTVCPHLIRYLTAAVFTNKKRRNVLKDLVRVITQESHAYRDPLTEFLECLYVNFDFESSQQRLRDCEKVLSSDFFLAAVKDEFIENARLFIFETYCRIHQVIDISPLPKRTNRMLASKLNMDQAAAEKWIVNLIRNARLDAKIDSAKNRVIMGSQNPSVYQQVIEKTKGLSFRSYVLANNIDALNSAPATTAS